MQKILQCHHQTLLEHMVGLNFSHVYEEESIYCNHKITWVDCTDILGTDCYCSEEAKGEIRERIKDYEALGIHFIDSGNYHYVTEFWLEKIKEPFCLVVLDNHSDMEQPLFGPVLSCGSWILDVISKNKWIQKVILLGPSKEQERMIPLEFREKISCKNIDDMRQEVFWEEMGELKGDYPVYISIDKDVLSESELETNWNQGKLLVVELKKILHTLLTRCEVIGIDVCGECAPQFEFQKDIEKNSRFNESLLYFLQGEIIKNN